MLKLSQWFRAMGQQLVTFIDEDPKKEVFDIFASLFSECHSYLLDNPLFRRLIFTEQHKLEIKNVLYDTNIKAIWS